jgi:2-oxoglutarate ferredoxin oxidoreductase subunit beta
MNPLGEKYLRKEALPTIFCPGCGHGTVLNATLRMLEKVGLENFLFVSGIGCSSWLPVFIKADVLHTLHGRAVAVATGLKLARPDKKVMVFNGDGDCLAIGGNHLIHAARRNIDLTVVTLNNYIYGMTGGQVSPGTPLRSKTKTSPYGSNEAPFDAVKLAIGAGATFVARETTAAPVRIARTLEKAVNHKGFSFVEIMSQCPTQAGRNIYGKAAPGAIMNILKESAVSKADADLQPGQFRTGIIHLDEDSPVYAPVAAPVAV